MSDAGTLVADMGMLTAAAAPVIISTTTGPFTRFLQLTVARSIARSFVVHVTVIADVMLAERICSLRDRIRQAVENGIHEVAHGFVVALATTHIFSV
jgi:hypothetical protein